MSSFSKNLQAFLIASRTGSRLLTLAGAGLLALILLQSASLWLHPIEERVGALGWTLFSDTSDEERITLVVIDERSIAEVGPWPWARSTMADLVAAIDDAGAQLQLHDIVYAEPRQGDEEFVAALKNASAAIIAQVPALNVMPNSVNTGQMSHGLTSAGCDFLGFSLHATSDFVAPAGLYSEIPKGHNAAIIDRDGGVRQSPAVACVGDTAYPSLAISAFLQLGNSSQWAVTIEPGTGWLEPEGQLKIADYPGLVVPVSQAGEMRIDFRKSPRSFRAVSAVDVLSGAYDPRLLDNAWVILGGTAFGMADIVPTPYSGSAFGVELQARLLASILDMSVPYTPIGAVLAQVVMGVMFAAALYVVSISSGRLYRVGLPALPVLLPAVAISAHVYVLQQYNLWIGWMNPAIYGLIAAVATLLLELARARVERGRVYQNLASYLPPAVAREVALSLPSSQVEAQRREVTLLNADIRNFSAFGETRPPEEIAAILHYFTMHVTEIIESHSGRVAEVRGDGVLAVWSGATVVEARQALQAAKKLQETLSGRLLAEQTLKGLEPLALGIGIEQGPVLIGSIGPSHSRSFTLLGDTVSTTLRIQEMTSELAQPILLGSTVSKQLNGSNLQSQGSYLLQGLAIPHTLFAPAPTAEVISVLPKSIRDTG